VESDLKARAVIAADDVEKAQIIRHARQVLGFDGLPAWHAPAVQMTAPEHQQPTLVDGPDNIGLRDCELHGKSPPTRPAGEAFRVSRRFRQQD
jgi:hypothetical protein